MKTVELSMRITEEKDDRKVDETQPLTYDHVCRFCTKGSLAWVETKEGWRLFEGPTTPHKCQAYKQWSRSNLP